MDNEVIVAEFKKNKSEVVRAVLKKWNGHHLIDLRVYYQKGDEHLPGPKGLCIQASMIPDLMAAVTALDEALSGAENAHAH